MSFEQDRPGVGRAAKRWGLAAGGSLARTLGVCVRTIYRWIERLREDGYTVERALGAARKVVLLPASSRNKGWCLRPDKRRRTSMVWPYGMSLTARGWALVGWDQRRRGFDRWLLHELSWARVTNGRINSAPWPRGWAAGANQPSG